MPAAAAAALGARALGPGEQVGHIAPRADKPVGVGFDLGGQPFRAGHSSYKGEDRRRLYDLTCAGLRVFNLHCLEPILTFEPSYL